MKIEVIDKNEKPSKSFPKLMVYDSVEYGQTIILAIGMNRDKINGIVISSTNIDNEVGKCSDHWKSNYFKDFEGSITLSND